MNKIKTINNNVLTALNEISVALKVLHSENSPNQVSYELDSEDALSLYASLDDAHIELRRLSVLVKEMAKKYTTD